VKEQPELFVLWKCSACKRYHVVEYDFSEPTSPDALSSESAITSTVGLHDGECDCYEA
jgi:hypothetical protein